MGHPIIDHMLRTSDSKTSEIASVPTSQLLSAILADLITAYAMPPSPLSFSVPTLGSHPHTCLSMLDTKCGVRMCTETLF